MSTPRKIRSDSVLGTQSEERQAEIAAHADTHKLEETVAWLRNDGIVTSRSSLGLWLSGFHSRAMWKLAESDALAWAEQLRKKRPDLSEKELQNWANEFFQLQAVKTGDARTFLQFATARHKGEMDKLNYEQRERSIQQREEALALEREKFAFDAAEACLKHLPALRQIASAPKLNHQAKILAIRQKLFGLLPETPAKQEEA